MGSKRVEIPVIKGKVANTLSGLAPYHKGAVEKEDFTVQKPKEVVSLDMDERRVLSLGLLLLSQFRNFGGANVSRHLVEGLFSKMAGDSFDAKELMGLEIEAYDILQWFGGGIDPKLKEDSVNMYKTLNPENISNNLAFVYWAIANGEDLILDYYTAGSGEFTHNRRITPLAIRAEKYIFAYCHKRKEERVFLITRIAKITLPNEYLVKLKHKRGESVAPEHVAPEGAPSEADIKAKENFLRAVQARPEESRFDIASAEIEITGAVDRPSKKKKKKNGPIQQSLWD